MSSTPLAFSALALGAVALLVWWFVRKRQTRIWLPTVRILRLESRVLPRLVVRMPPLVPFLSFALAALALIGFTFRPRSQVFTPVDQGQTRMHLFLDLSPSVSAYISLEDYAAKVANLFSQLKQSGRVSLSTSLGPKIYQMETAADVETLVKTQGFHRAGVRIGTAIKALVEQDHEIDRLIIVSDRDQHSWAGFNWRYLLDDMNVVFFDLVGGRAAQNVFINSARYLSEPTSTTMDWDIELGKSGDEREANGQLEVSYMGKTLGSFPWKIPAGKLRGSLRVNWPQKLVAETSQDGFDKDIPLVFRLEAQGGDSLLSDNEFRANMQGMKQDALIIGETAGERSLEDPAEQLGVALSIQGFNLRRSDFVVQPGPQALDSPLLLLLGGTGRADRYCPRAIEQARLKSLGQSDSASKKKLGRLRIWLAPWDKDADYSELCRCYAQLVLTRSADDDPKYCAHVTSRKLWTELLPSLGARQLGGQVGSHTQAIAWHTKDRSSGIEVLAFTVPLTPSPATGITHAQLPILIRDLLRWQGLLEPGKEGHDGWPRIQDLALNDAKSEAGLQPMRSSNVPLGESLLTEVEPDYLPPSWANPGEAVQRQQNGRRDRDDPLPWLKLAAALAVLAAGIEGVWTLSGHLKRFLHKRPERVVPFLAVVLGLGFGERVLAKVEINVVGSNQRAVSLQSLAREVTHRTSIEIEAKANTFQLVNEFALSEPWLWAKDLSLITDGTGALRADVALWLKRGGLLIVEAENQPEASLQKLVKDLSRAGNSLGFRPLPPDHELMRSFYLLDALPSCSGDIWRGFDYDGRVAILALPYSFLESLEDHPAKPSCIRDSERPVRVFVNLIMVALATDYKKDQIHLPEILKRLR